MSAVKSDEAKPVELTEEKIHLIAKALADPRRLELLRQIGRCEALRAPISRTVIR
jgi:hypothetical protein